MKKWTLVCMTLLLISASQLLIAQDDGWSDFDQETCCCQEEGGTLWGTLDPTLKVRVAAFWPTSDRFREIYGSSMPSYQIEAGFTFLQNFRGWVNFDWVYKKGHSEPLHHKTTINLSNGSFGVSFVQCVTDDISLYAGIGPSFGDIRIRNRTTKEHKRENKFAVGGVVKLGAVYQINCRFFLDLFVDYLYQPAHIRSDVNVGGLKAGIGVGTHF